MSKDRVRRIFHHMKGRCYCKTDHKYKNYGARGIKVCDEWLNNFDAFYEWAINNGYRKGLSIDRVNNDGDYEPNNCRWATPEQQANNRTTSHYYTYKGETKTIAEWSKETGIKVATLYWRINNNLEPDAVMSRKELPKAKTKYDYLYKGKVWSAKEVAKFINRTEWTIHRYFRLGYSIDDILEGRATEYGRK